MKGMKHEKTDLQIMYPARGLVKVMIVTIVQ